MPTLSPPAIFLCHSVATLWKIKSRWRIRDVYGAEKARCGGTVGIKFSLACAHQPLLPFGLLPLSSRYFTLYSLLTSPLLPSRRLDKGTFSVGQRKGGWKGARSDAPIDVSSTLVGMNVPSSLHSSLYTFVSSLLSNRVCLPSLSFLLCSLFLSTSLSGTAGCWQRGRDPGRGESRPWN